MTILSDNRLLYPTSLLDFENAIRQNLAQANDAALGGGAGHDPRTWYESGLRGKQIAPETQWNILLHLAGRGYGKTLALSKFANYKALSNPPTHGAIIAATTADVRDVMVEGESGILRTAPDWGRPTYEPSKRRLTWPNGSTATTYSADKPDRLRGPQHHWGICDELAAWQYAQDAFDMFMFGLRLGDNPQAMFATTPRPVKVIRDLVADEAVIIRRGTTYENRDNLAPAFFERLIKKYEGTTLGRQELDAELFDEIPGALWTRANIDEYRTTEAPDCYAIVVAVDPAVSNNEDSDETGIVVCGAAKVGNDPHGYVLNDVSLRASPAGWAREAVNAYYRYGADKIVAEKNNGGDMVEHTIRTIDNSVPVKLVHASRGKQTRAQPVASLYEQGRGHHVGGFSELEDQMCTWVPGDDSPDRMDALVWGFTELGLAESTQQHTMKIGNYA